MSYTGSGVLPYAYYNNTVYFLLGKEHKEVGWPGSEKYSDFGGSVETKHKDPIVLSKVGGTTADYAKYTAAVEFWEETMGLFYNIKEIFDLLQLQNGIVTTPPYAEHLLNIEYNPFWTNIYKSAHDYVLSCAKPHPTKSGFMAIPSCPEGFTEKIEIKWFSYDEIIKAVNNTDPAWSKSFRPEFLITMGNIIKLPAFKKLVDKASIFVDPSTSTSFAPIKDEPLLIQVPVTAIIEDEKKTSDEEKKGILLTTTGDSIIMDNYTKQTNNKMREIKAFIKSKNKSASNLAFWDASYCPLTDDTISNKFVGAGAYGQTYLMGGFQYKCCPTPMRFIVKSVKAQSSIDESDLKKINMDPSASLAEILSSPLTEIFSTEVASMAYTNYLLNNYICRNVPYFFGTQFCADNSTYYMYMQYISNKITVSLKNAPQAMIVQGIMAIMSLYQIKLVHGDINLDNMRYQKLDNPKAPIYKVGDTYYLGPKSPYILYFIDWGMGYIDDKLLPASRIEKDKTRVTVNINWVNKEISPTSVLTKEPYLAYKGYYLENGPISKFPLYKNAAYLRRHLLDLYLFISTISDTIYIALGTKDILNKISAPFIDIFCNPLYHALNFGGVLTMEQYIQKIHESILKVLLSIGLQKVSKSAIDALSKDDVVYMGQW